MCGLGCHVTTGEEVVMIYAIFGVWLFAVLVCVVLPVIDTWIGLRMVERIRDDDRS